MGTGGNAASPGIHPKTAASPSGNLSAQPDAARVRFGSSGCLPACAAEAGNRGWRRRWLAEPTRRTQGAPISASASGGRKPAAVRYSPSAPANTEIGAPVPLRPNVQPSKFKVGRSMFNVRFHAPLPQSQSVRTRLQHYAQHCGQVGAIGGYYSPCSKSAYSVFSRLHRCAKYCGQVSGQSYLCP